MKSELELELKPEPPLFSRLRPKRAATGGSGSTTLLIILEKFIVMVYCRYEHAQEYERQPSKEETLWQNEVMTTIETPYTKYFTVINLTVSVIILGPGLYFSFLPSHTMLKLSLSLSMHIYMKIFLQLIQVVQ